MTPTRLAIAAGLGAILSGCQTDAPITGPDQPPRHRVLDRGRELGTSYEVLVLAADRARAEADLATARALCRRLESVFSQWRETSSLSRINREAAGGPVEIDDDMRQLLAGALRLSPVTDGAFDITWRPLATAWRAAASRGRQPTAAELRAVLRDVGAQHVELRGHTVRFRRPGTQLGIDGVAKGWIIDALFHHLRRQGYVDLIVNIGGDLRTAGRDSQGRKRLLRLTSPFDLERTACHLEVENIAVATSGNYLRKGHILDPRTGRPPAFSGSATVLTRDAAMADALATAMFVMGPEAGMRLARQTPGLDVVFVDRDGIRATLPVQ